MQPCERGKLLLDYHSSGIRYLGVHKRGVPEPGRPLNL